MKIINAILTPFKSAKNALTRRVVLRAARKGVKAALKYAHETGIPRLRAEISKPENQEKIQKAVEKAVAHFFDSKK